MTTMATLFKRFALWKAQEGATVAELEQYQASTSLPSTVKMVVLLRAFSWTSAGLVLLWSWFYLGSQAVSREFAYRDSGPYDNTILMSPDAEVLSLFQLATEPTAIELVPINAAFNRAMFANGPQRSSTLGDLKSKLSKFAADPFDAALTPILETSSDTLLGPPDRDGWRTGWNLTEFAAYSGVPVLSPRDVSLNYMGYYTMNTSYIWPNCSDVVFSGLSSFPSGVQRGFQTVWNSTSHVTDDGLPTVDVWTRDDIYNKTIRGRCSLSRKYVQVKGTCDMVRCNSYSVRQNPNTTLLPNNTPFKNPVFSKRFFHNLLISSGIPVGLENATYPIESFLVYRPINSSDSGNATSYVWSSVFSDASIQLSLSQTMSYLINTYLSASQANGGLNSPAVQLYADTSNATNYEPEAYINRTKTLTNWTAVDAYGAPYEPEYRIVIPWIVLDFITCTILLLAAYASVWLRIQTVCPDVFGYVSSMTRDNPHIPVPKGGSTMSGVERARAMKNVRVKIGELERQDGAPGHIGLALEHPEIPLDKLRRKGEYM
jgi:hypothetical protein